MSNVTNTTTTNIVNPALMNAVNGSKAASGSSVQADQDKFMTLLVTQLKNQDPLNPLDNAQVTSQLAQLNTVTGINKLNETLASLKADQQAATNMQAVSLINHGVLVPGKNLQLAEGKAIFGVELASGADTLKVEIKNSAGRVVQTVNMNNVDAGTLPLVWDGKTATGTTAPNGNYTISVTGTSGGKAKTDLGGLTFGTVASVSTGAGGVKINVPSVGQLDLADIKQVL
jgi:flagellar basal-body rod modification protein FlgD